MAIFITQAGLSFVLKVPDPNATVYRLPDDVDRDEIQDNGEIPPDHACFLERRFLRRLIHIGPQVGCVFVEDTVDDDSDVVAHALMCHGARCGSYLEAFERERCNAEE